MPKLEAFFGAVRREILDGKGFILFKGIPVREWGLQKSATAYVFDPAYDLDREEANFVVDIWAWELILDTSLGKLSVRADTLRLCFLVE